MSQFEKPFRVTVTIVPAGASSVTIKFMDEAGDDITEKMHEMASSRALKAPRVMTFVADREVRRLAAEQRALTIERAIEIFRSALRGDHPCLMFGRVRLTDETGRVIPGALLHFKDEVACVLRRAVGRQGALPGREDA